MGAFTLTLAEVIDFHGIDNLGLDSYPVIGPEYRTRLNGMIVAQYLNREIGQETVSLWRHAMRRKMDQIMPQYNELYATKTLIIDPMRTVDLRTLTTTNTESETESASGVKSASSGDITVTSGSTSRNVDSQSPEVFLSDYGNYATSAADGRSDGTAATATDENAESTTNNTGKAESLDVMDSSVTGFQGSQAQLVLDFRATIINIDMLIVDELESLFMGLWNNGDAFFNRRI